MNSARAPVSKLGLALSGGGFRASLFHLGVLARLAELGVLPQVEVLSTVSGGSIVGAYYYLKIKQLLEGKRKDFPHGASAGSLRSYLAGIYVTIIGEIEREFLAAVQKNLRARALLNPYDNARMFLSDDYSRSDRMAELYDRYLYLPLWREIHGADASTINLREIAIAPVRELLPANLVAQPMNVYTYNAGTAWKIPILTINATTLNTGHPWRFTGAWVGEPPPSNSRRIDTNVVLPQLRFDGTGNPRVVKSTGAGQVAPDSDREQLRRNRLECITLADAVAASACVPGIFYPFALHDVYWNSRGDEIVVELVDGGVHDNQGIDALYDAQCTDIICSDASGQLEDERAPSTKLVSIILRSNDILMDRVRNDGYYSLHQGAPGVQRWLFMHMREQFTPPPGWPQIPGPVDRSDGTNGHVYRLSNLRTDLDSFSNIEAFALMYDGYGLCNDKLSTWGTTGGIQPAAASTWAFARIATLLDTADGRKRLLNHLTVGKNLMFKVFRLLDPIAWALALVLVAALGGLAYFTWHVELKIPPILLTVGGIITAGAIALAGYAVRLMKPPRWVQRVLDAVRWIRTGRTLLPLYALLGAALIVVSLLVLLQLCVFDRRFLRRGHI